MAYMMHFPQQYADPALQSTADSKLREEPQGFPDNMPGADLEMTDCMMHRASWSSTPAGQSLLDFARAIECNTDGVAANSKRSSATAARLLMPALPLPPVFGSGPSYDTARTPAPVPPAHRTVTAPDAAMLTPVRAENFGVPSIRDRCSTSGARALMPAVPASLPVPDRGYSTSELAKTQTMPAPLAHGNVPPAVAGVPSIVQPNAASLAKMVEEAMTSIFGESYIRDRCSTSGARPLIPAVQLSLPVPDRGYSTPKITNTQAIPALPAHCNVPLAVPGMPTTVQPNAAGIAMMVDEVMTSIYNPAELADLLAGKCIDEPLSWYADIHQTPAWADIYEAVEYVLGSGCTL